MRVGAALLQTIQKAEQLLSRLEVPPEAVGPVVQERRFRDSFSDGKPGTVDSFLASKDFKSRFEAAVEGTSYRASEAKKIEKKFDAIYNRDSFESFKRAPVALKASDLQRVCIAG